MDNKIVIARVNNKYILARIENDRIMNIFAYDVLSPQIVPGSIINGRISKKMEGIDASFVRVEKGFEGFINRAYKCESIIPVIYKKEPVGDKKPLFSDKISIKGEYTVCHDECFGVKTSSKISAARKKILKDSFAEMAERLEIGILLRTRCEKEEDLEPVKREIEAIAAIIHRIRSVSVNRPEYSVLYRPLPPIVEDCISLMGYNPTEIVTDDKDVVDILSEEYDAYFGAPKITERIKIRFYEDNLLALSKLYAFESKISEALSRIIHLKNGSFITFDNTEALTAIDVNSASYASKKTDKESMLLNVNKEAATEIVRHIYLRNISGIIIIDFINMEKKESYEQLAEHIRYLLSGDRVKSRFHDFTALGLAEISRQKVKVSFREQMR